MQEVGRRREPQKFPIFELEAQEGWRYVSPRHHSGGNKERRAKSCSQCYRQQERKGDIFGKGSEQQGLLGEVKKKSY